jgi:hypothetical protein
MAFCAGEPLSEIETGDEAIHDEIQMMIHRMRLRPTSTVGYIREAMFGRDEDNGLRLTIDSRIRGRDRDLDLRLPAENRFIIQPHFSIVEVKVNERIPYWLTEHIARHNLTLIRISKYCQSIEAFGRAPRSLFHVAGEA